jgi:hypothetical protein
MPRLHNTLLLRNLHNMPPLRNMRLLRHMLPLRPRRSPSQRACNAEAPSLTTEAHGQPWASLRYAPASSMPAISTSRPPNSGWSFSRIR